MRLETYKMATSILLKFLTLNCDISRTIWRIEFSDGSLFCIFHALSFERNVFFDRTCPLTLEYCEMILIHYSARKKSGNLLWYSETYVNLRFLYSGQNTPFQKIKMLLLTLWENEVKAAMQETINDTAA